MPHKKNSTEIGKNAESIAYQYLLNQGLSLIEKNFYCKCGEIDLIMQDGNILVFVEVRMRSRSQFGTGLESITYSKQKKIILTATYYLQSKRLLNSVRCRFDVVSLEKIEDNQILWIKNAFTE